MSKQKNNQQWHSSATIDTLKFRSQLTQKIRTFFLEQKMLEVETPILASSTIPAIHIDSFQFEINSKTVYLQTSPEFHIKRLLSMGIGDCFEFSRVFRKEENGSKHAPEFTLLEWYRTGWDYKRLMDEVYGLLKLFMPIARKDISYQDLFLENLGIDPFLITLNECQNFANQRSILINDYTSFGIDEWLDLFLTQLIEPSLATDTAIFVYDYRPSQAALAKVVQKKQLVAQRFEVYVNGLELANGFDELTSSTEQRKRFEEDLQLRAQNNKHTPPMDEKFLSSLDSLPNCSGVALGIDRLVMIALGISDIKEVLAFDFENA